MIERHWYKRYRPTNLDGFVFPNDDIKEVLEKFFNDEDIPDLLLSGIQGTGKSTVARMLITMLGTTKFDTKILNASTKTGIDIIRGIEDWTKTLSTGKYKVILFEEADRLTPYAQDALKSVIEDSPTNVKFIFTCNHPERISDALHSRFQHLHFTELDRESIIERCVHILDSEDIEVDSEEDFFEHVDTYYPDFRKIINSMQESSASGTLKGVMTESTSGGSTEVWEDLWKSGKDLNKATLLSLTLSMDVQTPDVVYDIMVDNISNLPEEMREDAIIHISEHVYRAGFVANQNLCLSACVIKIFQQ